MEGVQRLSAKWVRMSKLRGHEKFEVTPVFVPGAGCLSSGGTWGLIGLSRISHHPPLNFSLVLSGRGTPQGQLGSKGWSSARGCGSLSLLPSCSTKEPLPHTLEPMLEGSNPQLWLPLLTSQLHADVHRLLHFKFFLWFCSLALEFSFPLAF